MAPLAVHLTEEIADYMHKEFKGVQSPLPAWDTELLYECDLAISIIKQALGNNEKTSWNAEDYKSSLSIRATGRNQVIEEKLRMTYPPIYMPSVLVSQPCVVTDTAGHILLWYLPGIISQARKNQLWTDMAIIERSLSITKGSSSWRINDKYFKKMDSSLKPGNISLSPAWFQQAHQDVIEVSAKVTTPRSMAWLAATYQTSALIGGILSVIHPQQYSTSMELIKLLDSSPQLIHKGEQLAEILGVWSSPCSVITIMSNRETPFHRDCGAAHELFDILVPLGTYDSGGRFETPGLGLVFDYNPGTVLALAGRMLQHGATCPGNRVCMAYHTKQNVQRHLGIEVPSWAERDQIIK